MTESDKHRACQNQFKNLLYSKCKWLQHLSLHNMQDLQQESQTLCNIINNVFHKYNAEYKKDKSKLLL